MKNEHSTPTTLGDAVRGYYADHNLPEAALQRLMAEPEASSRRARRWIIAGSIAATIASVAVGLSLLGRAPSPTGPGTPKLVAVQIHADWCARSPEVAPIFTDLLTQYGNEPVLFVTLDITDDVRREQAKLLSATLGIPQAFDEPFQSGMIKLIDRESHRTLAAITGREQSGELEVRIANALAASK